MAANQISTFGWDTVYATRFSDVSRNLVSPTTLSASIPNDPELGALAVQGTFGPWTLNVTHTDGTNVFFDAPIPTSTLTLGAGANQQAHDFQNLKAVVQISLNWLSQAGAPDDHDTSAHQSLLKAVPGAQLFDFEGISDEVNLAVYTALLSQWLTDNPQPLEHIFALLQVNELADQGKEGFQWLKPTAKKFATVNVANDPDQSVFAVLCMTEGRPAPDSATVDSQAIPEGANAGFLIAPERVIENMLLPGIPYLFEGSQLSHFAINNNGKGITNKIPVQFAKQEVEGDGAGVASRVIQPTIDVGGFNILLESSWITLTFDGMVFEWQAGYWVHNTHHARATLQLDAGRHFSLTVTDSTTEGTVEVSEWVDIVTLLANLVGSIGGAMLGGALGEAAVATETTVETTTSGTLRAAIEEEAELVEEEIDEAVQEMSNSEKNTFGGRFKGFFRRNWAKMLGSLLGTAIANIPLYLQRWDNDHNYIPTLDDFGNEALAPLTWPGLTNEGISLIGGQLNGAFQMGFRLVPSEH